MKSIQPSVNPRFTQADAVVLKNLIQDVKSNIRGNAGAQKKVSPESIEKSSDNVVGEHGHDQQSIALLKAYNDPQNPKFAPTILTTWDRENIPAVLNRWVLDPYNRFARTIVRHPTDVVFLTHIIQYITVNLGSAIWLFQNFTYWHGVLHLAYTAWCVGAFTLLMHNHIHNNGVLKKSWAWLDVSFPYILEPLMGHTWDSYYYHHVKHHHVESNGTHALPTDSIPRSRC